jgi:hypothetical protein
MQHSRHWCWALALTLSVPAVHAAQATKSAASETRAAKDARAAREAVAEKQKQLFEEKNIPVATQAQGSATVIDLPLDATDSPGAVKK